MTLSLRAGMKVTASVVYLNAAGEPASNPPTDRTFLWAANNSAVLVSAGAGAEVEVSYPATGQGNAEVSVSDGTLSTSFLVVEDLSPVDQSADPTPVAETDAVSLGVNFTLPQPI